MKLSSRVIKLDFSFQLFLSIKSRLTNWIIVTQLLQLLTQLPQYEQKLTLHRLRVHRHLPQAHHHLRSRCLTESSSYRYRLELSECAYIQA